MAQGFVFFSLNFHILCQVNSLAWKQINDQIKGFDYSTQGKHCGDNFFRFCSMYRRYFEDFFQRLFRLGVQNTIRMYGHLFTYYLRLVCLFVGDQQNSKSD